MNNKLIHLILIVLIAVVSMLVYFKTSKLSYVADDRPLFYENTDFLEDWGNLKTTFLSPLPVKTYEPLPYYRPIVSLTYFVSYHLSKSIRSHHLFNLGAHTLNTILLYLLIFLLFKNIPLSIFTSLFFAAHPLHVSSVVWISGRTDLLACIFFLLTVILFIKRKDHQKLPRQLLLVGAAVSYILCLFSKETTLALPLFLFVWDYLSEKEPIRKKIIPYIPFVIITILYLLLRIKVIGNLGTGEPYTSSGLFHRFLTVFPIYFYYFKKLILPFQFNFSPRVLTVSSILSLKFLGSLIFFAIVLGLGISLRKRSKEVWFGILWILITLVPVLNLVPLYAPVKEWWAYIPSIGFCLILGKLAVEGIKWEKKIFEIKLPKRRQDEEVVEAGDVTKGKRVLGIKIPTLPDKILIRANHLFALFFALLLIFYAFNIKSQAEVFRKDIFFWRAAVKRAPYDAVAHNAYASILQRRHLMRLAEREFKKAIQAKPDFAESHNNLGMFYYNKGRYDSALVEIEEAIRLDSNYVDAYVSLGLVYAEKEEFVLSINTFKEALRLDPQHYSTHRNLGMVYSYIGRFSLAISHLEKALDLTKNPRDIKEIEGIIENFKVRQK
ncbi:MAG: tetratricopeptide repeat protein [candidate division Zixibacteria bacterium]|nr:tetratricopeptide repeat protein [candidate division Zixibacteria bacterium]